MSLVFYSVRQPKKGLLSSLNSEHGDKVTLLRTFYMTFSFVETLEMWKQSAATLFQEGSYIKLLQCFVM